MAHIVGRALKAAGLNHRSEAVQHLHRHGSIGVGITTPGCGGLNSHRGGDLAQGVILPSVSLVRLHVFHSRGIEPDALSHYVNSIMDPIKCQPRLGPCGRTSRGPSWP